MSDQDSHLLEATDWEGRGESGIRALLAEGVVAEMADRQSPGDARWAGGQTAGWDVWLPDANTEGEGTTWDAKSVRRKADGTVVLARWNGNPYDPEKVDHIVLVHMERAKTGFSIDLASGTARVEGSSRLRDVWSIPVADLNAMMRPAFESTTTYRNIDLSPDDLEPYRKTFES